MDWTAQGSIANQLQAYKLALLRKYARLHNVFPIQVIKRFKPRDDDQLLLPMPDLEDDEEWEIEEVKNRATIKRTTHYLVKWVGWLTKYNQQISEKDISNA